MKRLAACFAFAVLARAAEPSTIPLPPIDSDERQTLEITRWIDGTSQRIEMPVDVLACEAGATFVVTTSTRIGAAACGTSERIDLHPRAIITARFAPHESVIDLPSHGVARTSCGHIPFAFEPKKTTELVVPAGCGVVSLQAGKLAPFLIPPDALSTTKPHRLGDISLQHGASLLVRVHSTSEAVPLPDLITKVFRWTDIDRQRGEYNESTVTPLGEAITDRHGWASFYALTPDEVVLSLRRAEQRFPQLTERYLLDAGSGMVLDELEIAPAASLAVRLEVAEVLRESLVLTNVELLPGEGQRWPQSTPIVVPAVTDGTPSWFDVPAGAWTISAMVRVRNGFVARSATQRLTLLPGETQEVTLNVAGGIYRGRVLRGATGVRGSLNLAPSATGTHESAFARSGEDGRFSVLLQEPGVYDVGFDEPGKGSVQFERSVEFIDPETEVEIRLPEGQIRGKVVDENGAPVASATISAVWREPPSGETSAVTASHASSDAVGAFTVYNLTPGTWLVTVSRKGVDGDRVEATLADGRVVDGLLLTMRQTSEVAIHVITARGASVANAFAIVEIPPTAAHPQPQSRSSRSNADGVIRLHLPRGTTPVRANVIISTTDNRLSAALTTLDPDHIATVRLPAQTGELRLERTSGTWSDAASPRLVAEDGASLPVPVMNGGIARLSDTLIRLRAVPAGVWRYVEAREPLDALAMRAFDFARIRPLAEITVKPNAVNVLKIAR